MKAAEAIIKVLELEGIDTVYGIPGAGINGFYKYLGESENARMVAERSDIVITMLPDSPEVEAVVCGENSVLLGAKPDTILIDTSSIAPIAAQDIAKKCSDKGVVMLDAPVSGGEAGAIAGTLTFMVGGDQQAFLKVKDNVLLKMGSSATFCGTIGSRNVAKLANQIIVACNLAACAEAFTLAKKAGVNPNLVFDAVRGGLAGNRLMDAKLPLMLEGNFPPGFKLDLHIKDLHNALQTAYREGAPVPLTALVTQMMHTLKSDGYGQDDHSVISRYYSKIAYVSLNS